MSTDLWWTWAAICVDEERRAREARRTLESLPQDQRDMDVEFRPALMSVVAAALAIDGLYGTVRPWVIRHGSGRSRHAIAFEEFKSGFGPLGERTNRWPREFKKLFAPRDAATHFEQRYAPAVAHAVYGNISPWRVVYSVEQATEMRTAMMDVVRWCVVDSKPNVDAVLLPCLEWRARSKPLVNRLDETIAAAR